MEKFNLKFKLIYVRLLLILFYFVAAYSFLHWLLFIQLQVYDVPDKLVIWILPLTLPLLPVWVWLRKRIRLLDLRTGKGNIFFQCLVLASLFIGAVAVAFQYFLVSATGELRKLKTPEEIAQYRLAKYYTIDQYYADKSQARKQGFSHTSGKRNRTLHYETVIAVPLYNRNIDTTLDTVESPVPAAWICLYYKTSLDNGSSQLEKSTAWDDFANECTEDLKEKNFYNFTYFECPGNNGRRDKYVKTVGGFNYSSTRRPYVLTPGNEPYSARYAEELVVVFGVLIIGGTMWLVTIALRNFDEQELQKFFDEQDGANVTT